MILEQVNMQMQKQRTAEQLESNTSPYPARLIVLNNQVTLSNPEFGMMPLKKLMHVLMRNYKVHKIKQYFWRSAGIYRFQTV